MGLKIKHTGSCGVDGCKKKTLLGSIFCEKHQDYWKRKKKPSESGEISDKDKRRVLKGMEMLKYPTSVEKLSEIYKKPLEEVKPICDLLVREGDVKVIDGKLVHKKFYDRVKKKAKTKEERPKLCCPDCGSENIKRDGKRIIKSGITQLYRCKECDLGFSDSKQQRFKQKVLPLVLELSEEMSAKKISKELEKRGIKLSYTTVGVWIREEKEKEREKKMEEEDMDYAEEDMVEDVGLEEEELEEDDDLGEEEDIEISEHPEPSLRQQIEKDMKEHFEGKKNLIFSIAEWVKDKYDLPTITTHYIYASQIFKRMKSEEEINAVFHKKKGKKIIYLINPTEKKPSQIVTEEEEVVEEITKGEHRENIELEIENKILWKVINALLKALSK